MGEDQWFQPTVVNAITQAIVLANFDIKYGKFYNIDDPFEETSSAQGKEIGVDGSHEWGHCGRQWSPSGTEGTFEICLGKIDGEVIAKIYWDCPYRGDNKVEKEYVQAGYKVFIEGFHIPSGALEKGEITVAKGGG